jgi:hypothetical protein
MSALTTTIKTRTLMGNKRVHYGTATGSGTGGEIDTGLRSCEMIVLTANDSSVAADAVTLNETMPCDGSAVTVIHTAGVGYVEFMAFGY